MKLVVNRIENTHFCRMYPYLKLRHLYSIQCILDCCIFSFCNQLWRNPSQRVEIRWSFVSLSLFSFVFLFLAHPVYIIVYFMDCYNDFLPTRSRLGPTSMAFHDQEYLDGQSVYPSWCLLVNTTYFAPAAAKMSAHCFALKNSALEK